MLLRRGPPQVELGLDAWVWPCEVEHDWEAQGEEAQGVLQGSQVVEGDEGLAQVSPRMGLWKALV